LRYARRSREPILGNGPLSEEAISEQEGRGDLPGPSGGNAIHQGLALRNSSGSFATLAAIRRASSMVSSLASMSVSPQ